MAKVTKLDSPKQDDPIFSQPPTISVPVSKPSTSNSSGATAGTNPVSLGALLEGLKQVLAIERGTVEESMLEQIEKKLSDESPK